MNTKVKVANRFPNALKVARNSLGLTQEDFGIVSSRTYVSSLERGVKSPTLGKIEELSTVMNIHPLTLLALSYSDEYETLALTRVLGIVRDELKIKFGM